MEPSAAVPVRTRQREDSLIFELIAKARKLARILPVPVWRRALWRHGVAAGTEHAGILRSLGAVGMVVDIGANRGQFALAARHCFPRARIVSFEPLPGPAAKYREIFANDRNTTLYQVAIGTRRATVPIHVSRRDDSSSLLPIAKLQNQIFPGTEESGTETIKVERLESLVSAERIQPPALLKLDVQGYELEALKGSEDLLAHFAWIYAECSFVELYAGQALADEVIAWLRERRFKLNGVYNMAYDRAGKAVQADFLFRQRS